MQYSKFLTLFGFGLTHMVQVTAITISDTAVATPVEKTTADVAPYNWTTLDVATTHGIEEVLAGKPQTSVVLAVIAANSGIVAAVCSTGNVIACAATGITVVLLNFFSNFISSSGPSDASSTKRANDYPLIDADWLPTESCSTYCQLKAGAAHGAWTAFANATVNGVHHDLHFRQNGTLMGLRAVPRLPLMEKRDDVDNDGGIVAAYFWEDDSQQAYVPKISSIPLFSPTSCCFFPSVIT